MALPIDIIKIKSVIFKNKGIKMFQQLLRQGYRFFSSSASKPIITFTESALERFRSAIKPDHMITVNIKSGGCAGLRLDINHIKKLEPKHIDISQGYVNLVTDSSTAKLLKGAEIDFVDTMLKSEFVIKHPNIVSTCGCQESFLYNFNALSSKP